MEQVQLEVIDIWHFGLSALFVDNKSIEQIAADIECAVQDYRYRGQDVRAATEALAAYALNHHAFSVPLFLNLMHAVELDFDAL